MQAVSQKGLGARVPITAYLLKALPVLYGVAVVLSYGYLLVERATSNALRPSMVTTLPVSIVIPFVLGWLIARKHPGHTIALLFLVMAYASSFAAFEGFGGLVNGLLPARYAPAFESVILTLGHTMWIPGIFIPLFLMPLYFPTGELLSARWRAVVAYMLMVFAGYAAMIVLRPWPLPQHGVPDTRTYNGIAVLEPAFAAVEPVMTLFFASLVPFVLMALILRYRRSGAVERTQLKWPLVAVLCFWVMAIGLALIPSLGKFDAQYDYPLTWSMAMLFPISIGLAILRHNLWNIDLIINRTLVYASLTALIAGVYIVVVSLFGSLFQAQTNTAGGLVAAGIIALLFQPLRERLQRGANRLVYGERNDPAAVLTRLAQQLEKAEEPAAILPNLVQTIARTLKIPYVAIWLPGDAQRTEPVVVWGEASDQMQTMPLTYQKETIGHLVVAARGPQERFNHHEQELLATIAALTATTVRAVQLSDELRDSRRRIVTAREEERRRLRRDLHDGLGPQLASQMLGMEAVDQMMPTNPQKAHALLASLKTQAQEAILDVRRLVYNLRPPALDGLGLVGALQQSASRYETDRLRFTFSVNEPLPDLPAAVETATYRIVQEAMTNVLRHAQAATCVVRLAYSDYHLLVEVRDDGQGLDQNCRSGVGLQAMRERAAELNGRCIIQSLPEGGTRVQARLPLEVLDE